MKHQTILGVKVTSCSMQELNEYLADAIWSGKKEAILNVNINCMNLCHRDPRLRAFVNSVNLVFCDGDGVRLGAKILGYEIPEKITYNRWIWTLAQISSEQGFTWYLVGGRDDVIRKAENVLKVNYPTLKILGSRSGYFSGEADVRELISRINETRPNILVLGMGMPLQEEFLRKHLGELDINVALTGGAVFDYVSGNIRMTPNLMYRMKLEWFYRFLLEPRRLFIRYFVGNPHFFYRILKSRIASILQSMGAR